MDGERISDLAVCHLFWKRNKGMCDDLCDPQFRKRLNIGFFFFPYDAGYAFCCAHYTILMQMAAPKGDSLLNFRKSFAKGVKRRTHMNS